MPQELDELADLAPEDFVAGRNALAKRLKAEGDAAGAAEVRRLRKPTVPQWVAGQVRRHHDDVVDALRAASGAVADAQEAAITRGDRDALREASDRRRQAVAAVGRAVDQVLAEHDRPAHHRDDALSAIESAITAEVISGGFGLRPDLELPDRPQGKPLAAGATERRGADDQAEGHRREAEAEAQARAQAEAQAEADAEIRRGQAEARAVVEKAEARVERARHALALAEAELEASQERSRLLEK